MIAAVEKLALHGGTLVWRTLLPYGKQYLDNIGKYLSGLRKLDRVEPMV